jgi:hypothetical protein
MEPVSQAPNKRYKLMHSRITSRVFEASGLDEAIDIVNDGKLLAEMEPEFNSKYRGQINLFEYPKRKHILDLNDWNWIRGEEQFGIGTYHDWSDDKVKTAIVVEGWVRYTFYLEELNHDTIFEIMNSLLREA